uniref:protein-glutamine gamma-glutamyltransferase n=1 Tax=Leptobrachium leishanense TaxID=445787 RepID=A0A8C5R6C4_9ANUR
MATLQIATFDLHLKANRTAHHTDSYLNNDLILRRCQPFDVTLTFDREVTSEDQMQFYASLVTDNAGASLLEIPFVNSSTPPVNSWGVQRGTNGSKSMKLTFCTPSNAVIGRYTLQMALSGGRKNISDFILLFNCWAQDDVVYLSDEAQRTEYVLSEFGLIFMGEANSPQSVPWDYGQCQENILNICLFLMDSTLSYRRNPAEDVRRRNDPVYLCRSLSAIVNNRDDSGVVEGNWTGDYSEGTDPSAWTGSVRILKNWYPQRKPAKYGQCWVFAGVLCTVSRALGLPCRLISNFSSGHDTGKDMSIETYYKVTGEPLDRGGDSIWNFHCWNESWFLRQDLGPVYGGWQIWDSTPQELSDGIYQLGPASQYAIREGEVNKSYDTRFTYTEVNGDVIAIIEQSNGTFTKGHTDTAALGLLLCTKAVGSNSMHNVTDEYKYKEGTTKEREVHNKARGLTGGSTGFIALSSEGESALAPSMDPVVSGKITVNGTPFVGDDIDFVLSLKNLTSEIRNVTYNLNASAIVYNKHTRRPILSDSTRIELGPNEEKPVTVKIPYSQYENSLMTDNMVQLCYVCQVEGWGELVVESNITLQNPPLQIKVLGVAVMGSPLTVEVRFTNTLSKPLTDCVLTAEGSGITQQVIQKSIGKLEPHEELSITLETIPYVFGTKQLLINLMTDKLHAVKGYTTIDITEG